VVLAIKGTMATLPPLHRLSLVSIDTGVKRPLVIDDDTDEPSSKKPNDTEIWMKFQKFISDLNNMFISPDSYQYFNAEDMKRLLVEYDQFEGRLNDTQASEVLKWIYQLGRKEFIRMAHQNADLIIKGQKHAGLLPRPASREWWIRKEETDPLLLERDENGYVVVDLWHARVGHEEVDLYGKVKPKPEFFDDFTKGRPTFFMESKTYMMKHWDEIVSYVCPDAMDQKDLKIYIKCGRFTFKPLLWFDDTDVEEVLKDVERKQLLAKLIDSNAANANYDNKSIEDMDLEAWKKATYKSAEEGLDNVLGPELRIDNNCVGAGYDGLAVQAVNAVLETDFAGTLCVDVSGAGAALTAPHHAKTSSENNDARAAEGTRSIVLWDVPGTLDREMTGWIQVSDPCDPDLMG